MFTPATALFSLRSSRISGSFPWGHRAVCAPRGTEMAENDRGTRDWERSWLGPRSAAFSVSAVRGHPILRTVWLADPGLDPLPSRFRTARLAPSIVIDCPNGAPAKVRELPSGELFRESEPVRRIGLNLTPAIGRSRHLGELCESLERRLSDFGDGAWCALRGEPDRILGLIDSPVFPDLDPATVLIVGAVSRAPTRRALREAIERSGLSARSIRRKLKRTIGMSPDRIRRLQRVTSARALLTTSTLSLPAVAARLEFSDQAHLTHEFAEFCGYTPAEWRNHVRRWRLWPSATRRTTSDSQGF